MDLVRVLGAGILGVIFAVGAVGNVWVLLRFYVRGTPASLVPLVSGMSGALALAVLPVPRAWRWAWIPPLLDLGCVPMVAGALGGVLVRRWRR